MGKKYELIENGIEHDGRMLYSIRALKDFADVCAGEVGGLIEREDNLSQEGDCWLYTGMAWGNARIYDDAKVHDCQISDNAQIYGDALVVASFVRGNAKVFGGKVFSATVEGNAEVYDEVRIYGLEGYEKETRISGDAQVYGRATIEPFSVIKGKAVIHGEARVFATIGGRAEVSGNARVMDDTYDGHIIGTTYRYA